MKNHELVKHIETNNAVEDIRYKGLQLWLEIRNRFYSKLFEGEESTLKIGSATYRFILKTFFYGFWNWFKNYDAWFIGSSINRVEIEGKYYDRHFDFIATQFKKSLFIELSTDHVIPRKKLFSKYVVSKSPLIILEKCFGLFVRSKKNDFDILNKLKQEYNVEMDFGYAIKKMITQYKVMKLMLLFKKPKVVFIAPSYTAYGYIKALKEKGVKVVEVQHGVILKEHFGYNVYAQFDRDYFVDSLLTLGQKEKAVFGGDNKGISLENVIPVGSFYLDYMNSHVAKIDLPNANNKKYKIAVSLQELPVGDKLMDFIIACATLCPDYVFYLKTRRRRPDFYTEKYSIPSNVIFITDLNVYELIQQCDYHMTIYSTCALEAPALGVQNILVDIDGKAKAIFGEILKEGKASMYCKDVSQFVALMKDHELIAPDVVAESNQDVIAVQYKKNIKNFLSNHYA
ncbi:hypothetical protein [Putridiphycobacter roseus]|nr:hypothetical protein [Putridiphycobacter roseus]